MTRVGIIDYGIGNLRSVSNAVTHIGATPVVSEHADCLIECDRIIFPGVGAFGYGMDCLKTKRLDWVVTEAALRQKPLLGICVGMQMLFEKSGEFGDHNGLGVVPGQVNALMASKDHDKTFRLPNVGWATISIINKLEGLAAKIFSGIEATSEFYFVHSFGAAADSSNTVATSNYAGNSFAAVVAAGSVIGTQFHPEKSGPAGLKLLRNFIE